MQANQSPDGLDELAHGLQLAEQLVAGPGRLGAAETTDIRSTLRRVEVATPLGAPLHAQLDNARRWLDALERPVDYERFGGIEHLRQYVVTQLRLAQAALADYRRASGQQG